MTLKTIYIALLIDIIVTLAHYFTWDQLFSRNFNIFLSIFQAIITIFLLMVLTRHSNNTKIYAFRLNGIFKGILYGLLYILFTSIFTSKAVHATYFDANSVSKIFFSTIIFYALWAFLEELLYRGIIFLYFIKKKRVFIGIIISSILFSLGHAARYLYGDNFKPIWFITDFFTGNVYATIFLLTGNIWGVSIAHFMYNLNQAMSVTGDYIYNSTVTVLLILSYYWTESLSPVLLVLVEKYVFKGRKIAQRFPMKNYIIAVTLLFIFLMSVSYLIYILTKI